MEFSFEELGQANFIPGAIYHAGDQGNFFMDEPISKIFKLEKGLRGIGNQSGIRRSMVVTKNKTDEIAFMVIINTGKQEEWLNKYDEAKGLLTYYGDNKTPGNHYLKTKQRGNLTFEKIYQQSYEDNHSRFELPPIFYFERLLNQESVRYIGLALPFVEGENKSDVLQLKEFSTPKGFYQNYEAKFTIVNNEVIERNWLYDLKYGQKIHSVFQPNVWTDFLVEGNKLPVKEYQKPLKEVEILKKGNHTGKYLTKARLTQHIFRDIILKKNKCKCEICDITNVKLLVASHIIPWRVSQDDEKTDVNNGLLLCANHDKLFDQGFITFNKKGDILISEQIKVEEYAGLKINKYISIEINSEKNAYLKHHRTRIFKELLKND